VVLLTTVNILLSADYYAVKNGNWNLPAVWSNSCGGGGGYGVPGAGDNAFICSGVTVNINVNSSVNNLYLLGGIIDFPSNSRTLTVNNDLIVNNTNSITGNSPTKVLNVGGSLFILSSSTLDIAGQTVNISGDAVIDGVLFLSNNKGIKSFYSNLIIGNNARIEFIDNVTVSITNNLVTDDNSAIKGSDTGIMTIGGDFEVLSGGSTTIGRLTMTVDGSTVINGNVEFNDNTGTKTFVGQVTVNSSGEWKSTAITDLTNLIFKDGIVANGDSFEIGACTFSTNDQSI